MANNCSIVLKADKLPVVLKKVEFYLFRAIDASGISYGDIAATGLEDKLGLLSNARELLEADMLKYSKSAQRLKDAGREEEAKFYASFAENLQGINANWVEATKYFLKYYGGLINIKTKFKLDADGMINMDDLSDEEDVILANIAFDQPANEIDPIDNIDKTVELYIRGIQRKGIYDEYGFNVLVDYGSFVRGLSTDLENTTTLTEILKKLEDLKVQTPEYQLLIDKLSPKPTDSSADIQFRINFRNSFAKASIPIYITSVEDGVIKVFEATVAGRSAFLQTVSSNFLRRGMPVTVGDKSFNLAHQENGIWILDKSDLNKVKTFIDDKNIPVDQKIERRIQFLEALGFEFSADSRKLLAKTNITQLVNWISGHTIKILENDGVIKDPIKSISSNVYMKGKKPWYGQKNALNAIANFEVKYNKAYNVERSVVNPEGNRQHVIQNHNNFTVVNKFLSDPEQYPTLQSIITAEPSLAWLDPVKNPTIANDLYLNSLFFFNPQEQNFGMRKRVTKDQNNVLSFSATDGEFVKISIVNTGGVQAKNDLGARTSSNSSTGLETIDKLFQDINTFTQKGFTSIQRLSDKSTDLAIYLNYYSDPVTGLPVNRILGGVTNYDNIYTSEPFVLNTLNALRDVLKSKYLAKKGFYKDLAVAGSNVEDSMNFGVFTDIFTPETKKFLNDLVKITTSVDQIDSYFQDNTDEKEVVVDELKTYFEDYTNRFFTLLKPVTNIVPTENLIGKGRSLNDTVRFYLANTFLSDIENLKLFFGDPIFFKAFHKRSSKDSATGIFTFIENSLLEELNDYTSAQGYGKNTNLGGRMLVERLFQRGLITKEVRDQQLLKQLLSREFKSAVLTDVKFQSNVDLIIKNIELLRQKGEISDEAYALYKKNIRQEIENAYKKGNEADGQGKATFDFYRIMSILTSNWGPKQEEVYQKIVMYSHYDELVETEKDEAKKAEYLQLRDAVGYDPLENVYFPPKKFQYSGPMEHLMTIDGQQFTQMIPVFDKFSLQPLIPTIIKGTADAELAKRMEFSGVGYVKFESGTKVESPKNKDSYYSTYNPATPETRSIETFEKKLIDGTTDFKSEQTLFFTHFKEQVRIDSGIHDNTPIGTQMRKLILLNILGSDTEHKRKEFEKIYSDYVRITTALNKAEKRSLYASIGISESADGKISIRNLEKLIQYFFTEIDKKNQDSSVKKALNYNEETKSFDIPLDGSVQAQIIENIIISSVNNRLVRQKVNGSMLTQVSITGSERVKFSKEASEKALETFGNQDLQYYQVVEENGKAIVKPMQVKIALTGQWQNLLSLKHPDGNTIETIERLNQAIKDERWKKAHKKSITLGGYRIPTAGMNFIDVMEVAEFLPAQFGDAIILPSEIVIKNGSDFDIDKMFVYYPNLLTEGDNKGEVVEGSDSIEGLQNQLYDIMFNLTLHPANYLQLITPSSNYHIMPTINEVYKRLYGKARQQTDYKNTQLVDREFNIKKFESLLNGKADLGIAAVANTFNVLYQLVNAKGNPAFFKEYQNNFGLRTFFTSNGIQKDRDNKILDVSFSEVYDEDGVYKSEFFTEFINAFVDVAADDYVFAVNVVTELSPVIFYMKYIGISTPKIIAFINQPAIRTYITNLKKYDNLLVKTYLDKQKKEAEKALAGVTREEIEDNEQLKVLKSRLDKLRYSTRKKALSETLRSLGYTMKTMVGPFGSIEKPFSPTIQDIFGEIKDVPGLNKKFTSETLMEGVKPSTTDISKFSQEEKTTQLAYLFELLNLRAQSDSLTETQSFQKFDTKPYTSSFDIFMRNASYQKTQAGETILSKESADAIVKTSVISPLNAARDIVNILEQLLPVRNNVTLNSRILRSALALKEDYQNVKSEADMQTYARTYKNDLMSYILYNYLEKSQKGAEFFKQQFKTDKPISEYVKELIDTPKLLNELNEVRNLPDDGYAQLAEQFPFVKNIVARTGDRNNRLISFKFIDNSQNPVDRASVVSQFAEIINLESKENEPIVRFFKNLALYSTFQSGYNFGEFSYTATTPIDLINRLYGYAVEEFSKLTPGEKIEAYDKFNRLFEINNPSFYKEGISWNTPTGESNKRGKWYSETVKLDVIRRLALKETDKPSTNPLVRAGVRPEDMAGNAAKDIEMADQATQFIGYKSGTAAVSSTERYKDAWGDKANTGNYTSEDVVMVSASGTFRGVTRENIFDTFEQKYQSILDKAIAAGATFVVGNRYDKGNLGDFLVADYLKKKGYFEEKFDGYSKWTSIKSLEADPFKLADVLDPVQQNFADSPQRTMRPEFRGKSTMDLIISGDRTRTTRSKTEIKRLMDSFKVSKVSDLTGKIVRMTDKKGRMVYARITKMAIFTQEYQDATWMKEGWTKDVTDKLVGQYPYAIEFEVVRNQSLEANIPQTDPTTITIEDKIENWVSSELPWSLETPASEIAKMYETEQLNGETIEEFLQRMSCNGKLK